MENLKFEEIQKFRQKGMYLLYALLLGLLGLFIFADIYQIILGKPFGDKPAPNLVLVIGTLFLCILLVLFYMTKLVTIISDEGVFFRWPPFSKSYRQFSWNSIDKIEIIKFVSVGIGWRLTPYGTLHTTGGNDGLMLTLKTGEKIILGTQKPIELADFLSKKNILK